MVIVVLCMLLFAFAAGWRVSDSCLAVDVIERCLLTNHAFPTALVVDRETANCAMHKLMMRKMKREYKAIPKKTTPQFKLLV
jgi:hypothetical protein